MSEQEKKVAVYFDGRCYVCSAEMEHYSRLEGAQQMRFVDITGSGFQPSAEGLESCPIQSVMHAKLADGRVVTGVDAFIEIWKLFPRYRWMVPIASHPWVKPILKLGYLIFARGIRPWLPKKKLNLPR